MRRTRLIWFALGALLSATVSVGAAFLIQTGPTIEPISVLVLWEPDEELSDFLSSGGPDPVDLRESIPVTGPIARDCGIHFFWIENPNATDGGSTSVEIPLVEENFDALGCVFEQSTKSGVETNVHERRSANVPSPIED